MDVTLVLVQHDHKQREIPVRKPSVVIGRDTNCQIRIPTDAVSRRHCELTLEGDGLTIKDLGSSNGTFVNRRRVTQSELGPGDVISVGPMVLVVRVDGKPKAIDPEAALAMSVPTTAGASSPAKAAGGVKPAPGKGKPASLLDDDDEEPSAHAPKDGMEDSSLSDFDFLDDEDQDKQPKL